MGMFSWTCAVCNHDMLGAPAPGYSAYASGKVLLPDGDVMSGEYDGYGHLGCVELTDLEEFKLVHTGCWKPGMSYETLGETHSAHNQGFYPEEARAEEMWGPPNLDEIRFTQEYVCLECKRTWRAKWSGDRCPFGCPGRQPCHEHGLHTFADFERIYSEHSRAGRAVKDAFVDRLVEEQGLTKCQAWTAIHQDPLESQVEAAMPEMCPTCRDFNYTGGTIRCLSYGNDALGICHTEEFRWKPGRALQKCPSYGELKLVASYDPKCGWCKGEVEVVPVIRSPLAQLAVEAETPLS